MTFANPWLLLLLAVIPLLILHYRWQRKRVPAVRFSSLADARKIRVGWPRWIRHILFASKLVALTLLILSLARPQKGYTEEEILTEGVDIIVTLDVSGSMAAEDFSPRNRLFVAKDVVKKFIQKRRYDRIGMVVFAADSFTKCPLTLDYGVLMRLLDDVQLGTLRDGTAIGTALATSVNRLKSTKAESKVIVLLTDGVNNAGEIDPLTAAEIAKAFGIKVYAIGVGNKGLAPFPVDNPLGGGKRYVQIPVELDEEILQQVVELTEGQYFRATDKNSLEEIFKTIDALEKSEVKVKSYSRYNELFALFLIPAMGLLFLVTVLSHTRFRILP